MAGSLYGNINKMLFSPQKKQLIYVVVELYLLFTESIHQTPTHSHFLTFSSELFFKLNMTVIQIGQYFNTKQEIS